MKKLDGWTHIYSGKVRDIYVPARASNHAGDDCYLIVASDRISAYDYVLPSEIPGKGEVLTQLSLWWFEQLGGVVENHVLSTDVPKEVAGRAMITRRLNMYPIECVVRGYLTGSGLAEYKATQAVCGVPLPEGLTEASYLHEAIFTPAAKAKVGEHDENITFEDMSERVGGAVAGELRRISIEVYEKAREIARRRGIIIADTKFEFGTRVDSGAHGIILADEVLTPDSSRFWYVDGYREGEVQPSLDKQFVRDWLTSPASGWSPRSGVNPPSLPDEVIERTRERYIEAYETLTGRHWQ